MKYIIIGDDQSKSIGELIPNDENKEFINGASLFDVRDTLKKTELDKFDIIVINIEGVFDDNKSNRSCFVGVNLLKWMRIHLKICNRIILTGFYSREKLLQQSPKDYILFAPSNYYLQLPFSSKEFLGTKRNSSFIKSTEDLITSYKPFVSPDFKIEDISHAFSNEFGIHVLGNLVYQYLSPNQEVIKHDNLSFSKAELLYNVDLNFPESKQRIVNDKRDRISEILKQKKIIYIDDQGEDGWFALMRSLLGISDENLIGISPKENDTSINYNDILNAVKSKKPDFILLDLRLLGDLEKNKKIEETSGAILLKLIRKWNPAIPVMLTSATDRIKSLDILSKIPYNIDSVWTKPRIEKKGYSAVSSVLEFYEKVKLLNDLSNDKLGLTFKEVEYRVTNHQNKVFPLLPFINTNFVNQYDYILFDTNYFCETTPARLKKHLLNFKSILKFRGQNTKIAVIDDVINEVYLNSYKGQRNSDLSRVSRYTSKMLSSLLNEYKIITLYEGVQSAVNKEFTVGYNQEDGVGFNIFYNLKIKQDSSQDEEYAKLMVEILRRELSDRRNPTIIHADNIFKHLIRNLIANNQKVLLVTNDINCKRDIAIHSYYGVDVDNHFKADYEKDNNGEFIKDENGKKKRTSAFKHTPNFDLDENCKLITCNSFISELKRRH